MTSILAKNILKNYKSKEKTNKIIHKKETYAFIVSLKNL